MSEKTAGKADTLVKLVLVSLISLFAFSVGTFVGKQVSDADHRRAALEGELKGGREVASHDGHDDASEHHEGDNDHSDKISEKEIESLTEEFVNKEKAERVPASHGEGEHEEPAHAADKHADKHTDKGHDKHADTKSAAGYKSYSRKGEHKADQHAAEAEHKPKDHKAKDKHQTAEDHPAPEHKPKNKAQHSPESHGEEHAQEAHPQKAADKVAHGEAPTDGHGEARKPTATLPSVASTAVGKYTIQVAAHLDESMAKTQAADLKGKGWSAFYLAADVNGKTYYRVLVGLFNNIKSAQEFKSQFLKDTHTKDALVQKIVQ